MARLYTLAVLFFISSLSAAAVIVRSMRFDGNHAIPTHQLLESIRSKPNSLLSLPQLHEDIKNLLTLYQKNGFYYAEVGADSLDYSNDSSFVDIVLNINEKNQLELGSMRFEGNTILRVDDILAQFDTRVGGTLDNQVLEHDIDRLLARYERMGYPFAKVEVRDIGSVGEGDEEKLEVMVAIDEGAKVCINEIKVAGNTETHESVIVRETRIKPGETFDQEKLLKIQQRLNRLNIFSSVREPELYMNTAGGGILVTVQEGTTNTFDGVVGYAPAGMPNGEGTFSGLVDVSMRNLFGTARKLHVQWQKEGSLSQQIALQYVEPWVIDLPVNLGGGFLQRQQDTSYIRRVVDLNADLLVSESFSVGGLFTHESIIPSSTTSVQRVSRSRTITTGVVVRYDSRDDILSPTSGVDYRSDYQIGNKKVFSSPQQDQIHTVQKVSIDADYYTEPFSRQVVAVGIHGRQLTSDLIETGDLYRFGGTKTLRGYLENEFLGSRVAWTNTEYRFLLARHSFFYGFFDSGYYFLPGDDVKGISSIQHLKYGYGIGIRMETSLGNIGVSVALGEGDTFSQAKLHIGLINDF